MNNMGKLCLVWFCMVTIIACNSNENKETSQPITKKEKVSTESIEQNISKEIMLKNGVLRIKADDLQVKKDTVFIYNDDFTLFGKIYSENESEEPVFIGQTPLNIRAYYPDYYTIIFDSNKLSNEKYQVIVNGSEKYISYMDGITLYEDWEIHMKTSFIVTDNTNPLRETPNENSNQLNECNYATLSFEVIEISNDWAKVVCNMDCEGCPKSGKITGWLRWKKDKKLLVKLYYVC